jgi:tetratricopeptide (TPR) repeat protein
MGRSLRRIERERGGRTLAALVLTGALSATCPIAMRADDFNEERLQAGRIAFQQKRFTEAIDQLRLAAFGSLDRPVVLSECLARLALAQAGAGKATDADHTLDRFLEVERRFGVYGNAHLEPDVRTEFQRFLDRRIPAATLAAIPTLAGPGEASSPRTSKPGKSPAKPASSITDANPPKSMTGPPPVPPAERSRQALAESHRFVIGGRPAEAETILTEALKGDPNNRELRLALLEAASLNRSYPQAVAQVSLVSPFSDREASSMFYAAVALYEVGRREEARTFLQRARSNVSGVLVDEYSKKIMGQP